MPVWGPAACVCAVGQEGAGSPWLGDSVASMMRYQPFVWVLL